MTLRSAFPGAACVEGVRTAVGAATYAGAEEVWWHVSPE